MLVITLNGLHQVLRNFTLRYTKAATRAGYGGDVDAKRAEHGATPAHGALTINRPVEVFEESLINLVFLLGGLQDLLALDGWDQLGIPIIGEVKVAGVSTKAAMGAYL
jgi:hypothetical protein